MEVMMQDPKMQEMMYPYLPEPMRNPETFNFVLKDPTMRKQLVQTLAQSVWGGGGQGGERRWGLWGREKHREGCGEGKNKGEIMRKEVW